MAKILQQVLGARNLIGVINKVANGVPNPLPDTFQRETRRVPGDHCTYYKQEGTRKTARETNYGGDPRVVDHEGLDEQPVKLIHSFEEQSHKPATLMNLESTDGTRQQLGRAEVARQTAIFAQRYTNLRIAATTSMLAHGKIWFDADGNLLSSASGAKRTIDAGVPANNRNQLNGIITTKWSTASATILDDIQYIQQKAAELTGQPIRYAFHGIGLLNNLLANTQAKELINRNTGYQEQAAVGVIPQGFGGLIWKPMYLAMYQDHAGTYRKWFASDKVVFAPEVNDEWWELIVGSLPIPKNIGAVYNDAVGAAGNMQEAYGRFSYATIGGHSGNQLKQFGGDTFIPIIKNPEAVFIADVEF